MSKRHSPRFLDLVNQAKRQIPEVTVAQVMDMIAAGDSITLVDTREQSEWAAGHIAGAIHLGKGVIERDIEQAVPDTNTVLVLYCGGGYRSALAAAALHAMGYAGAVSMDGGWRGWNEAGGRTESD
jgi:rhodanese-related sulfurtransferase